MSGSIPSETTHRSETDTGTIGDNPSSPRATRKPSTKVTSKVRDLAVKLLAPGFPKLMSGVVDTAREAGADLNPYSSYDEVNQELLVTALFAVVRLASETGTDPSPGYKARSCNRCRSGKLQACHQKLEVLPDPQQVCQMNLRVELTVRVVNPLPKM
ncbi:hypothetical protein TREMEDRAFT_61894 [Tremella mesenterica DSM 1558]|uniref:uncharacterized protein n=1 Tax=Tremella mesenterica (strain ATCC 24925 / CBS 8224 / DSM 1558 / NBRC 9311 / NRRL Y-6157 / RJB 2259-6 / UBC 559-6) TaxID=578456 RepID=UPI0003F4A2A4|nr:uncharacterized protein TREMEDRAFT_61894 [Tremella mesenterica DSM 1558]EIW70136.1 hypothetical protein TREMEDRAFT_61894 [Tremella mesenterica DSM 1558]